MGGGISKAALCSQQTIQIRVDTAANDRHAIPGHGFTVVYLECALGQTLCQFCVARDRQAAVQVKIAVELQLAARGFDRRFAGHDIAGNALQAAGGGDFAVKDRLAAGHFDGGRDRGIQALVFHSRCGHILLKGHRAADHFDGGRGRRISRAAGRGDCIFKDHIAAGDLDGGRDQLL